MNRRLLTALCSLALLTVTGCSTSSPVVASAAQPGTAVATSAAGNVASAGQATSAAGGLTSAVGQATSAVGEATSAVGETTSAVGQATSAAGRATSGGAGVAVDCSALTQAQITAATGGKPDAGKPDTDFPGGCQWEVTGSALHTAADEKTRGPVELVVYTQMHNLDQFQLSFPQLTPEPEISGKINYWEPMNDVVALFDGTKDVEVELVTGVGTPDAASTATAKAAATALAKDLIGG